MARTPSLRIGLADISDPVALAAAVLTLFEPERNRPTPIERIACDLDIDQVDRVVLRGAEGILLTDSVRSVGAILANESHRNEGRIRFTIAHELGHFLLEHHQMDMEEGFTCSPADMGIARGSGRHARQEAEANRFAIEMLAPRSQLAALLESDPDIATMHRLAKTLEISREAALRRLVDLHPEPLAVVFVRDGVIRVAPRNPRFPWLHHVKGSLLPAGAEVDIASQATARRWRETPPGCWCTAPAGHILQQSHVGANGHGTVLLWHRK